MIECLACRREVGSFPGGSCPECGFAVARMGGFEAWAPELAIPTSGEFFEPEKFKELATLEDANFWFQARNELILWGLKRYFSKMQRYAEIGCGTGFVLSAVEREFPRAELLGTELFVEGLKFASQRCERARLVQLDARRIPYRGEFDVVGIFDVLEHIGEDDVVLNEIARSLKPGGGLIITVPQHAWLWSPVDEAACHVRRYSASEIERKVSAAGFEILRSTSFVSLLLPAMFAARFSSRGPAKDAAAELRINRPLNAIFRRLMSLEFRMIRSGIDFAYGGSRLVIATRGPG